jgi:hypothetical protein
MATMGDAHIQLFAPADLIPVKKGYRAGKPDTPQPTDNGAPLLEGQNGPGDDDHDDDDTGNEHPAGSPEAALAGAVAAEKEAEARAQARHAAVWPFPTEERKVDPDDHYPAPPAKRRGRNAAAA